MSLLASPNVETQSPSESASNPVRHRAAIGLVLVVTLFVGRCWDVARRDAITSDETTHLTHSLHYWITGDDLDMWELGAPRLPHLAYGLASYLALRASGSLPDVPDEPSLTALVTSGSDRVLLPARSLAILSGVALLLSVFWAVARTRNAHEALIAVALLSLVPECLAHSAIAGSDMPFTAAAVLAVVLLARFAERPSWSRWLSTSALIGLAWAMRHSAILLLILAAGVHLVVSLRRKPVEDHESEPLLDRLSSAFLAILAMGFLSFAVLWAGDGFQTLSIADLAEHVTTLRVPEQVGPVDVSHWRLPSSALSLLKQVRHQSQGHEAYFCGQRGTLGWPTYFPVAFLLKTPVGLLGLFMLTAACVRPRGTYDRIALAALGLLWLTLIKNHVNIGVRYAFLTYPLAIPFVARLFARDRLLDPVRGPLVAVSTLAFLAASISAHPRYLSSFNELAGGPSEGWIYLADSNVDWGQDFSRLAAAVPELGIKEITTDISSERRLKLPGVYALANPSHSRQVPADTPWNRRLYDSEGGYIPVFTRYVAVSTSRLLGLYSQNDMSWLLTRKLVARVGDSIYIFDMDEPADRPFGM